jgi:hypothetical protein
MTILNIDSTQVTITDVFDTRNKYLYQKELNIPLNPAYTKLANPPSATLGRKPANITSASIPSPGYLEYRPFVYRHSWISSLNATPSPGVALLLIDRAPLMTGTFDFFCASTKFQGTIRRLGAYEAWSYEKITSQTYSWIYKGQLGYAIEVDENNGALAALSAGTGINAPPGVLVDQRSDNIILSGDTLLWPQFGTISGYQNQLTYRYTTEKYVLNGELPTEPVYVGLGVN